MADCANYTIDSNITGLRYAEESCIGSLPLSGVVWYPLEPNSYGSFGGEPDRAARATINDSRQRQKGEAVGFTASAEFDHDLTKSGLWRLLQGFFMADARQQPTTAPLTGTQIPITGVTTTYAAASGLNAFSPGDLVLCTGFSQAANNGLKVVSASTATALTVTPAPTAESSPPATASISRVGHQFAAGDLSVVKTANNYPQLVSADYDLRTLNLVPGQSIWIGGDSPASQFASDGGFARVRSVSETTIVLDKTERVFTADAGVSKTIQLFFGDVLKNELGPLIKKKSYQFERTTGEDEDGVMSEYTVGAMCNQLTLNLATKSIISGSLRFVATNHQPRTGEQGVKSGSRPDLEIQPAFNTTSDFFNVDLHVTEEGESHPVPLFAHVTDMTIDINNGLTPAEAMGVMGALDVSLGDFAVSGSIEAYFTNMESVKAVRNNADVSLSLSLTKNNGGSVWDMPLLGLGGGQLNVVKDEKIKIPLTYDAARGALNHTLMLTQFHYLPNSAMRTV